MDKAGNRASGPSAARVFIGGKKNTRTLEKKNNNKAGSFFRLNLNVYIYAKKREARARNKKQWRSISVEEKQEDFIAAVRK